MNSLMSESSRWIHSSRVSSCVSGKPEIACSIAARLSSADSPATFAHVQRFRGRSYSSSKSAVETFTFSSSG
jgi:hypothetical protein